MARIILVGGGSSSGKSFVTKEVLKNIGEENITRLTMDDYYLDQTNKSMEERFKVNYDHPKAFDWPLMRKHIQALKNDQPIEKPIYDFLELNRSKKTEIVVPKKVVIIEGIMALVDNQIRNLGDIRVFINAGAERRFLRRLIRDSKDRGRSFESIVNQYFSTVQPMYDEIVKPSSEYADLIINNDGVKNLAIDVLTCVIEEQLDIANNIKKEKHTQSNEFGEETLRKVFLKVEGN